MTTAYSFHAQVLPQTLRPLSPYERLFLIIDQINVLNFSVAASLRGATAATQEMTISDEPIVFTPSDEPYLGRELLHAFDNLICPCLELNSKCAPTSHGKELSDFQHAMCILVPQTISLALSIRELIRQGYLFGAKVLVRPFTERAVTALYLYHNSEALKIWNDGWEHRKRPTLQKMIENLNDKMQKGSSASVKGITHELNSATHGDPLSAKWNVVLRDDGVPVFLPSKNLKSPGLADEICAETIPWLATTMVAMSEAFGVEEAKPVS